MTSELKIPPAIGKLLKSPVSRDAVLRALAAYDPGLAAFIDHRKPRQLPGKKSFFNHDKVVAELERLMSCKGDFAGDWQMKDLKALLVEFINETISKDDFDPRNRTGDLQIRRHVERWRSRRE